jgi:hypothetical protein
MARPHLEGQFGAFALGIVVGIVFKGMLTDLYEHLRAGAWRREPDRVITYPENLPESLERREPAPHPGQIRYGGTGALGVSPESVRQNR